MEVELKKLEKGLDDALENFRAQIEFDLETFEQSHKNEYLTDDDLEEMGRQVYYCLANFKNKIIKYLKEC